MNIYHARLFLYWFWFSIAQLLILQKCFGVSEYAGNTVLIPVIIVAAGLSYLTCKVSK